MHESQETLTAAPPAATLTSVSNITHSHQRRVTPFNSAFAMQLAPAQPLTREVTISEVEQEIDLTGFEAAVVIGVKNLAGTILSGRQTDEARAAIDAQCVILGPDRHRDALIVRPRGATQLLYAWPGTKWYWRAAAGVITVELFAAN